MFIDQDDGCVLQHQKWGKTSPDILDRPQVRHMLWLFIRRGRVTSENMAPDFRNFLLPSFRGEAMGKLGSIQLFPELKPLVVEAKHKKVKKIYGDS